MLRREWEIATSDLRDDSGVKDRKTFSRALDELQAAMLVVPSEVYYQPKFTYIWTLAVGRFPNELRRRIAPRRGASRDRPLLFVCGRNDRARASWHVSPGCHASRLVSAIARWWPRGSRRRPRAACTCCPRSDERRCLDLTRAKRPPSASMDSAG